MDLGMENKFRNLSRNIRLILYRLQSSSSYRSISPLVPGILQIIDDQSADGALQIASDYLSAFEKLMKAYSEIADALPRFDQLGHALKDQPNFQAVLAVFYCDILDIHRRAYKFFRPSGNSVETSYYKYTRLTCA